MSITAHQLRRALEASLICISKDPFRYVLSSVRFRADAIEATDGHRLLRIEMPPGFVDRTGCATEKAVKRFVSWLKYDPDPHKATKFPTAEMLPFADVTFPETSKLWPTGPQVPAPAIGWNAKYLGDLAKISKLMEASGDCVKCEHGAAEIATVFEFCGAALPAKYLLMPMRIGERFQSKAAA